MSYKTPDGRLGGLGHPQPGDWEGYKRYPTEKVDPNTLRRDSSRPTPSSTRLTHVITRLDGSLETL